MLWQPLDMHDNTFRSFSEPTIKIKKPQIQCGRIQSCNNGNSKQTFLILALAIRCDTKFSSSTLYSPDSRSGSGDPAHDPTQCRRALRHFAVESPELVRKMQQSPYLQLKRLLERGVGKFSFARQKAAWVRCKEIPASHTRLLSLVDIHC